MAEIPAGGMLTRTEEQEADIWFTVFNYLF